MTEPEKVSSASSLVLNGRRILVVESNPDRKAARVASMKEMLVKSARNDCQSRFLATAVSLPVMPSGVEHQNGDNLLYLKDQCPYL